MSRILAIAGVICMIFLLAGVFIALAGPEKEPPTELYVRTLPPGAKVLIDGKPVGMSDNLFQVEPGDRKIEVELDGYEPVSKEVTVSTARIARVAFTLKKTPPDSNTSKENILTNPGAEDGDKAPAAWEQGLQIPGVKYSWDKKVAFKGKASLCIEKTANRYFPIASWSQTVERKGDAPALELSAQVKARKMTKAILDVVFLDKNDQWISHKWAAYIGSQQQGQPPANHDWKQYSGKVDIPPGTVKLIIGLQVYGPGKVWYDDVQLREVKDKDGITTDSNFMQDKMIERVEDFFRHNFRDVTERKTIEWGDVNFHEDGRQSIRYKYLASIWGEKWMVMNQIFTFDAEGKFVKCDDVEGFPKKEGEPDVAPAAANDKVQRRSVGKKVADFPEATDLSTPESAWAAYHRASARKDAKGVVDLSWVKCDPAEMERFWNKADPADLAVYNKAQLEAECVEVLTYRGEVAAVISRLAFPPGKGRHPYSRRSFGLIDGKWKNFGEDRLPSLEAARADFEKKKNHAWVRFSLTKERMEPQVGEIPRLVKVLPEIGATDVDPELKEIRVTFDRDMKVGSHSWCGGGPHFPEVTGEAKWIDQRTCVLPVKLKKANAYRLALNWGEYDNFRSTDGVPAIPTVLYFCTHGAGLNLIAQMTPPKVVKMSIENGTKNVPPGRTKLSVTFDQAMGGGMSWCSGPDTPNFEPVEGSAWSGDKKTCSIYALLEPGRSYTICLNSERFANFMNELGVSLKLTTWRFTTAADNKE